MDIYGRIKELAYAQKISIRRLEENIGFGNGTINRWAKTTPGVDKLEKVADYFHVSTDYLLGRENKNATPTDDDLDDMIDHARSFDGKPVTDHDREIIKAYLKGLYANKN